MNAVDVGLSHVTTLSFSIYIHIILDVYTIINSRVLRLSIVPGMYVTEHLHFCLRWCCRCTDTKKFWSKVIAIIILLPSVEFAKLS